MEIRRKKKITKKSLQKQCLLFGLFEKKKEAVYICSNSDIIVFVGHWAACYSQDEGMPMTKGR